MEAQAGVLSASRDEDSICLRGPMHHPTFVGGASLSSAHFLDDLVTCIRLRRWWSYALPLRTLPFCRGYQFSFTASFDG